MKKKTNFYFLFLMQRYGEKQSIPRKTPDSSQTCMDKRLNLGQIAEICSKLVQ